MATANWYLHGLAGMYSSIPTRRVAWATDTVMVSLHTSAYAINGPAASSPQDTNIFFDQATDEVSGGNYVRQVLGSKSLGSSPTQNYVSLLAGNTIFPNLTATFRFAVVWKDTGTASTSPLLGFVDLSDQMITSAPFVVDWHDTDGVLRVVVGG